MERMKKTQQVKGTSKGRWQEAEKERIFLNIWKCLLGPEGLSLIAYRIRLDSVVRGPQTAEDTSYYFYRYTFGVSSMWYKILMFDYSENFRELTTNHPSLGASMFFSREVSMR